MLKSYKNWTPFHIGHITSMANVERILLNPFNKL